MCNHGIAFLIVSFAQVCTKDRTDCSTALVTILVNIVVSPLRVRSSQDTPLHLDLLAENSPNADPLSLALVSLPQHGTVLQSEDGKMSYAPSPSFTGDDMFSYRLCAPTSNNCGEAPGTQTSFLGLSQELDPNSFPSLRS